MKNKAKKITRRRGTIYRAKGRGIRSDTSN